MEIRLSFRAAIFIGLFASIFFILPGASKEGPLGAGGPLREEFISQKLPPSKLSELALLTKKEEILKEHLKRLAEEDTQVDRERNALKRALTQAHARRDRKTVAMLQKRLKEFERESADVADARKMLLSLAKDKRRLETLLLASYRQTVASRPRSLQRNEKEVSFQQDFALDWPVTPLKGLSATFHDAPYKKRFGMEHYAIDIPTPQGSPVYAAAEGEVLEVHDQGMGYSTISLQHKGDLVTLYGHVSEILVSPGDYVAAGERIALSGGRPGSKGAGLLTTGPHLHLEVYAYGQPIDPLYYLAPVEVALSNAN